MSKNNFYTSIPTLNKFLSLFLLLVVVLFLKVLCFLARLPRSSGGKAADLSAGGPDLTSV